MSAKSRNSSARKRTEAGAKRGVAAEAIRLAEEYETILASEDGRWYGRGLELPYVFGEGQTPAECIEDTRAALAATIAHLWGQGEKPPAPSREGKRNVQVNIRLTSQEKALLESVARRKGFEGLSEFFRTAALEAAR